MTDLRNIASPPGLNRRQLLQGGALTAALFWPGFKGLWGTSAAMERVPTQLDPSKTWNIITVVTDDQAIWGMGAYGNQEIKTPVLDRLAQESALFTNAFASVGVCTPSRVSILTGKHSIEVGALNDAIHFSQIETQGLPPNVPTWPRELQNAGYKTALIGKWHLGSRPDFYPTKFGYDYFYGFLGGANRAKDPGLTRDGETRIVEGFTDDLLTDDAISWIGENKEAPFALSLHFRAPHLPYGPVPQADSEATKDIDPTVPILPDGGITGTTELYTQYLKKEKRDYYAAIHCVDRNVGRLLDKLDELGLTDKTIVLFTTDQGYLLGERGLFNKGAAAPIQYWMFPDNRLMWVMNMYDLALRVPLLVKWPGVVQPGLIIDELVSLIDLYPSIVGMLGVEQSAPTTNDAMDFTPLLTGQGGAWRDILFGQYTPDQLGNLEFLRMARTKQWKLVRTYMNPAGNQLFDLQTDPEELDNLYHPSFRYDFTDDGRVLENIGEDSYADIRNDLQTRLSEWQKQINDPALELENSFEKSQTRNRARFE